jgi:cyanophycinase
VLIGAASAEPGELFDRYRRAFADLGVKDVVALDLPAREEALAEGAAEPLRHAGAVFFTGGDQLRLTSRLGGTPVFEAVRRVYQGGGVVAGTSAGASALSDTMLVSGEAESSPKLGAALHLAPGFGLLPGVIIDQHFAERGRMGRLLAAVAQNPASLGLGIDEDTAIVAERSRLRVVGRGGAYVFDAASATLEKVAEAGADETLSVHDVALHALRAGDRFDLNPRRPFRPAAGEE